MLLLALAIAKFRVRSRGEKHVEYLDRQLILCDVDVNTTFIGAASKHLLYWS